MIVPVLAFGAVMLVIAWSRLMKAEAQIDTLAARVKALEATRRPPVAPDAGSAAVASAGAAPAAPPTPPPIRERVVPSAPAPVARPAPMPLPPPASAAPSAAGQSLETRIATRWMLYVGVLAIIVGVSYFEKLAIDNGWLGETARVMQGGILGLALVYIGWRFAQAGYALYGQVICGGGVAVLYLAIYAAFDLYALISRITAFALMSAITGLAAWLADRQRSEALALMAVGGGFLTPFLLPGGSDAQLVLLSYDAILIAGTMALARRRDWPALNGVSYGFAALTFATWAARFYAPSKYLRTELFLTLYCAMFLFILRETRRAHGQKARIAEAVLWTAPAAYYLASITILSAHSVALLIFLVALALLGAMIAARAGSIVRLVFWIAVVGPLMPWAQDHAVGRWLAAGLAVVAAIYVIYLAAHLEWTTRGTERLAPADIAVLHLNGLAAFGCAYVLLETTKPAAAAPLAAGFALLQGSLAWWMAPRHREHALHFAALAFTLLMVAIALQFDGPWVTSGWAAEGAVVIALGLREKRDWLRIAGLLLFFIALGRLLSLLFAEPRVDQIVFLNRRAACGFAVAVLTYWIAWLHRRAGQPREVAAAILVAQVLTLAVLTSEIVAYWEIHASNSDGFVARGLMLSLTWAVYATALVVVGIRRTYAPIRYFAIGVFAITIVKVFAFDLATLDRIYRVSSVIGLGVLLLVTSYLYQRPRSSS